MPSSKDAARRALFQTIMVNSPAGLFTAGQIKTVSEIAAKGSGTVKLTHTQRMVLSIRPEELEEAEAVLKKAGLRTGGRDHGVKNIRACSGAHCERSVNNDAEALCLEIDERFYGFSTKFTVKMAVSDCARNCSESYSADIGFIGLNGDYRVVIGGRGARVPFRAIELIPRLDKTKVVAFVAKFLRWYNDNAQEGERLCKTLQRMGYDIFGAKPDNERHVIKNALENLDLLARSGDGVSEGARAFDQYLRGLAVDNIRDLFQHI